jgi:hypothetical protein
MARFQVSVAAPIVLRPPKAQAMTAPNRFKHPKRRWHNLGPDAVSGQNRNVVRLDVAAHQKLPLLLLSGKI